jgi:hypothetical protein
VADDPPDTPSSADAVAADLIRRLRATLAAAEQTAADIRATADAEGEARARTVRAAAEQDAERMLRRAEREAAAYLDEQRRRVDAFAAGRARRISAIADRLIAHAEALDDRTQRAGRLRQGIDELVAALAAAAEAIAAEAQRAPIRLPSAREGSAEVTRLTTRPHAVPDPEPPREGAPADDAREHVREIASALPRRPGTPPPDPPPAPTDPAEPPPAPDAA